MNRIIGMVILFIFLSHPSYALANKVSTIETKSGIKAWMIEDHTLPIVTMRITFLNCGSAYDPDDVSGLASLTSLLLDEGAEDLSGTEFKKAMSNLASYYNFSVDKDNFYINIKTLSKNLERTLELITKAVTAPRFENEPITRSKNMLVVSLSKQEEEPNYIAQKEWEKRVFGSHPYSKPILGRKEAIENITRAHLQNYVKKNLSRNNLLVSAVGDISDNQLNNLLENYLSKVPPSDEVITKIPKFTDFPKGQTYFIEKSLPQTVVMFGQRAVNIKDKNFYPLNMLNYTLGGGSFESRLMQEIREKRGLAYNVYSYIDHNQTAAALEGFFATDSTKVAESLKVFKDEIAKLKQHGITEEELALAKSYSIGSFALRLDSYEKLVNYLNFMQIEGLDTDFLEKRNQMVEAVTFDDVKRVTDKIFDPEGMTIVVVGKSVDAIPANN